MARANGRHDLNRQRASCSGGPKARLHPIFDGLRAQCLQYSYWSSQGTCPGFGDRSERETPVKHPSDMQYRQLAGRLGDRKTGADASNLGTRRMTDRTTKVSRSTLRALTKTN